MRITPTLTLCAALAAGNPALAQPVLRDIGAMLSGAKSGSAIVRSDRGLLLETRHCIDGPAPVAAQLRGQRIAHHAGDQVHRTTGRVSDDQLQGLGRKADLCSSRQGQPQRGGAQKTAAAQDLVGLGGERKCSAHGGNRR